MKKINILFFIISLSGCSNITNVYDKTFKDEIITCPKILSPNSTSELVINSENNVKSYVGFRGISKKCFIKEDEITMYLDVNIRSIRKAYEIDDYIPIKIYLVSVDESGKEYDRNNIEFKMFLKSGSKIVDRETNMKIYIPRNGVSYIGLFN